MRGRILVVDHTTPTPDQDSGSASSFAYLRILTKCGLAVTYAPADLADAGRYTKALADLGIAVLTAPEWTSMTAVVEMIGARSDALLLYRGAVARRIFDLARRAAPNAKIVFHPVDLHFLRMQREATLTGDPVMISGAPKVVAVFQGLLAAQAEQTIEPDGSHAMPRTRGVLRPPPRKRRKEQPSALHRCAPNSFALASRRSRVLAHGLSCALRRPRHRCSRRLTERGSRLSIAKAAP
jgi:hypothetical protein